MYDHRSYSIGQEAAADAKNGYVKRLQCPAAGTDSSGTTSCLINATKNNQAQAGRQIEVLLYHDAMMPSTNTTPAVANCCQEAGASSWLATSRQPGRAQSTFRQADALAVTDSPYHAACLFLSTEGAQHSGCIRLAWQA